MQVDAVICGAGIAGIAVAHALVRDSDFNKVLIIERGAPLSLTSDKSTECYRNWWPGPDDAMLALSNRSIDLMETLARQTNNAINMDRRGYLYLSAQQGTATVFIQQASEAERLGAGALRIHQPSTNQYQPATKMNFDETQYGSDLLLEPSAIQHHFPYVSDKTAVALHVRRAGALSAQQLGMVMLEQAREGGAQLLRGDLVAVDCDSAGAVIGVHVNSGAETQFIHARCVINAAGPHITDVAQLVGLDLPVVCERHVKLTLNDTKGIVARDAPLSIWCDQTTLPWSDDERAALQGDTNEHLELLAPYPAGVHGRPVGAGKSLMLYWTYDCPIETPQFPVSYDPSYAEIVLRGMSVMIPGLAAYYERMPNAYVDGGYYTKTMENRPLLGPTAVDGFYLCGALSGFGIMMAMGAAELVAAHARGAPLPAYAHHFELARYEKPGYQQAMADMANAGQL